MVNHSIGEFVAITKMRESARRRRLSAMSPKRRKTFLDNEKVNAVWKEAARDLRSSNYVYISPVQMESDIKGLILRRYQKGQYGESRSAIKQFLLTEHVFGARNLSGKMQLVPAIIKARTKKPVKLRVRRR